MKHVVGVSDMKVSANLEDVLVTYSLGSCIGLTLYDQDAQIGGMVHTMLPLARKNPERAKTCPAMFTDSGVMALIQELLNLGASKQNLVARAAGGAAGVVDRGVLNLIKQWLRACGGGSIISPQKD
ncbi:MAG: chemotaxis protein CheD [Candidatus Hydrogenedentes bacterium]|nr:chemotaxis protein CheD [Candidatus Hydrogenedentota bacterium]